MSEKYSIGLAIALAVALAVGFAVRALVTTTVGETWANTLGAVTFFGIMVVALIIDDRRAAED
jgi:hypothetical protein